MRLRLSKLKPGEEGIITAIEKKDSVLARRMAEMGMTKGERVRVIRNAPFKDPIEFEVKGYHLSLKRDEAKMIIVEVNR